MSASCLAALLLPAIALAGCDRPPDPPAIVKADGKTFSVSDASPLEGTRFVAISVMRADTGGGPYSSSSAIDLRNVVILDTASGDSRRLLPGNTRHIRAVHWLSRDGGRDRSPKTADAGDPPTDARWYLLEVERAGGKALDLVAGDIAGGRPVVLASGIDTVDFVAMSDPTHATLVTSAGGRLAYRLIDMTTLRQVAQKGIAI